MAAICPGGDELRAQFSNLKGSIYLKSCLHLLNEVLYRGVQFAGHIDRVDWAHVS